MNIVLKKDTTSQIISLGPLVLASDGTTPYTTALANTAIKLHKFGGTTLTNKNSGGSTHISDGIHYATLDATDSNTLGTMIIYIVVATVLIQRINCTVVPANVYESLVMGTEWLSATSLQPKWSIASTTLTVKKPDGITTQYTTPITPGSGSEPPIVGMG